MISHNNPPSIFLTPNSQNDDKWVQWRLDSDGPYTVKKIDHAWSCPDLLVIIQNGLPNGTDIKEVCFFSTHGGEVRQNLLSDDSWGYAKQVLQRREDKVLNLEVTTQRSPSPYNGSSVVMNRDLWGNLAPRQLKLLTSLKRHWSSWGSNDSKFGFRSSGSWTHLFHINRQTSGDNPVIKAQSGDGSYEAFLRGTYWPLSVVIRQSDDRFNVEFAQTILMSANWSSTQKVSPSHSRYAGIQTVYSPPEGWTVESVYTVLQTIFSRPVHPGRQLS